MKIPALKTRQLLDLYNVQATKQLSQNFLLDLNITDKIVRCSGTPIEKSVVVEIGPGPGGLTRSLLNAGVGRIVAIEKDLRMKPLLDQIIAASDRRLSVIYDDITTVNHANIISQLNIEHPSRIHLIGNLPFGIASSLLVSFLKQSSLKTGIFEYDTVMTLMFQKEVASRISAKETRENRCKFGVLTQSFFDVNYTYEVPGSAFTPKPKVDAAVLVFKQNRKLPNQIPFEFLESVLSHSFSHASKKLKNNLKSLLYQNRTSNVKIDLECVLSEIGLDVDCRPKSLSIVNWMDLTNRLYLEKIK